MTDFEFYCDEYGGTEIEEQEEFDRLAKKARLFISRVTYSEPDFEDDDVRSCLCALAEIYADSSNSAKLVREKIDDFEAEYDREGTEEILMHTVRLYLPPVLLYRGF
ncbi:MAG: hypothetical protein IJ366_01815 [Clostridia bacterium]|nr:hypothetical protein [Clostridia bacterium]